MIISIMLRVRLEAKMSLTELIKERRTIHVFQDRSVPLEWVQQWLDAAVWAPNHRLTQPWRFVIVHGEGRKRLAEAVRSIQEKWEYDPVKSKERGQKFYDRFMAVPMYVVVINQENRHPAVREEDYAATSCLIHNFSLLAWEQGVGMVWETYPMIYESLFMEALGVQPGERIVGSLHLGYPEKIPAAQTRIPAVERTTIIDQ